MSICSFLFDSGIEPKETKVDSTLIIMVGDHAQEWIDWPVGLRHDGLDVVLVFKSYETRINNINNICRH